jgi:molybdate transport system substrate-binding protein
MRYLLGVLAIVFCAVAVYVFAPRGPRTNLVVLTAASLRPVMEDVAKEYSGLELRFGGSEELMTQIRLTEKLAPADVFLPADASYLELSGPHGSISPPLATMHAVAVTGEKPLDSWAKLTAPGVRLALAEPKVAAIGKLTKAHLEPRGLWEPLAKNIVVSTDTVTQSANAVKLGTVDAAIVWDATARQFPALTRLDLPELQGIQAEVRAAVLLTSRQPTQAKDLLDFLASHAGRAIFARHGFPEPAR